MKKLVSIVFMVLIVGAVVWYPWAVPEMAGWKDQPTEDQWWLAPWVITTMLSWAGAIWACISICDRWVEKK